MAGPVGREDVAGIAVLVIDNPPVNALSAPVREGLLQAMTEAEADPSVQAIVLAAEGRTWPVGADIREFERPAAERASAPSLPEVCDALAGAIKPVVAALHGTVLGGGLELALAATARVAAPRTSLGFPEVTLGLLPGAGGTQRAPRLIGARAALEMMLGGVPVGVTQAQALGLVDLVADDAVAAALDMARSLAAGEALPARPLPPDPPNAPGPFLDALARARAVPRDPRLPAPGRIIDCVEAALVLPADEGAVFERTAFAELLASPESAALRHMFQAERSSRRSATPRLDGAPVRRLAAVAGWGEAGADMARLLLAAGLSVTLFDADTARLTRTIGRVASGYDHAQAQGQIGAEERAAQWARFEGATAPADLNGTELFIDLAPRDAEERAGLISDLAGRLDPAAIVALAVTGPELEAAIAAYGQPGSVVGLWPAGPGAARLFELLASPVTARATLAELTALLHGAGRIVVRTGLGDAAIGERLLGALHRAADELVDQGVSPYAIDRAMEDWGMSPGPFQAQDRAGLLSDAEWRLRQAAEGGVSRDNSWIGSGIGTELLSLGRTGQAAGRGYYRHEGAGGVAEDPEVTALVATRGGDRPLRIGAVAIADRMIAALANEGARLIEEGIARCPGDIDLVAVWGLNVARWRGGPMQVADRRGLLALRNDLRRLAAAGDTGLWQPARLWDTVIRHGKHFDDLNREVRSS